MEIAVADDDRWAGDRGAGWSRRGNIIGFQSDTELIVEAPGGKPNELVDVRVVFEPGGELVRRRAFRFVGQDATSSVHDDRQAEVSQRLDRVMGRRMSDVMLKYNECRVKVMVMVIP